jgi:hypothetical protein
MDIRSDEDEKEAQLGRRMEGVTSSVIIAIRYLFNLHQRKKLASFLNATA